MNLRETAEKTEMSRNVECLKNRDEVETGLKIFRQDVEHFFLTCHIGETGLDVHAESLVNLISCGAVEIYNQIESVVEDESWNDVLNGLEDRYASEQNSIIWQYMFFMRVQEEHESFDQFYAALQEILVNCRFGEVTENLLKTQIALGVNVENTRTRLLERDMDLDYMIVYCQAAELFEKKRARLTNSSEVKNCDQDPFSLLTKNSVLSNLNNSNLHGPKERHFDFSTSNSPAVRKSRGEQSELEIRPIERDNRLASIEELQSSNGTEYSFVSKSQITAGIERSNYDEETSHFKAISKLKRCSVLSNAINLCDKFNNFERFLEAGIDKDLHVMYQDYNLLNDILDVTMGQACNDNGCDSFALGDRTKPWLFLRRKIVKWLESHNRGNVIEKRTRTSKDHSTDGDRLLIAGDQHRATELKKKTQKIVEELVSTEETFVEVLTLLCGRFVASVKAVGDDHGIPPVNLAKIFNPLPQLLKLSEMMLKEMRSRSENWHNVPRIADIIVNKGPFLKLYSTYIQNFKSQTVLLDECCKKYPRFGQCVKEFEASEVCKHLTIKQYMLAPIQRIPRYKLLLNRYLKSLDETSIDYKNAVLALDIISDVGQQVDKSAENEDCTKKLVEIQSKLRHNVIIKPGRELIKEGELYKLSRKHLQLGYFILMNDVFYYTCHQNRITGLKVKYELPLKGMKVQTRRNELEFSVISSTRSFSLRAQTPASCKEWVASLESSINKFNKRQYIIQNSKFSPVDSSFQQLEFGNTAPVWIQDTNVSQCQLCAREFTFCFRRHHCRACGKVVCAKCSKNKAPLYYKDFQSVRVCDECFEVSLAEFTKTMPSILQKAYEYSDFESIKKLETIKKSFKSKKNRPLSYVSQRSSQLMPNDNSSIISGWLHQRASRKKWDKCWFVLNQHQTLFVFKALEDISPIYAIDVFLYKVERFMENISFENYDSSCVFQLASNAMSGMIPLVFRAHNKETADKWIHALSEAADLTA